MTYKIFDTLQEYNDFTLNGTHLTAGTLYLVKENKSLYFLTNNIDGEAEKYEYLDEIPEGYIKPEGNIIITENGEEIDISTYATASVNVAPNLTTQNITENGTYEPSGDYDGFSSVTVNVAGSGGNEYLINLIERDITSINIPSSVTSIGNNAFSSCTALTSINIPSSVTSIGDSAFTYCSSLTSITIPDGVTSVGTDVFHNCSSLTSITIPDGVTSVGIGAFQGCTRLTSVIIPDSVTSIGGGAFRYCSSLTTINIPDGVTSVGNSAFRDSSGLTSVIVEAATPPTLGTTVFAGTNTNLVIYAPAESVEAYKTATNWSAYADRIQAIS